MKAIPDETIEAIRSASPKAEAVELFLGQAHLLIRRCELGLPSHPENLRNLSRVASELADLIEGAA